MVEFIREAYEVFTRRIFNQSSFKFIPNDRELKQIENFIKLLEDRYDKNSIGKTFLFNFIAFNYDYYSTLDYKAGNKIPLNWIIGKKALSRWVNRTEDDLYHATKYATDNKIHLGLIKCSTERKSNNVASIRIAEENEKKRFHNKPLGMVNCLDSTTLYNHRSPLCISCKYRSDCKKVLKANFPKFYISRGYAKI